MSSPDRDDELDILKAAFASSTPAPDTGRKAENIALAMQNFERLQGSTAEARQTSDHAPNALWAGVKQMFSGLLSTRGGLTATTAMVGACLLVLTPQGRNLLNPNLGDPTTISEVGDIIGDDRVSDDDDKSIGRDGIAPGDAAAGQAVTADDGETADGGALDPVVIEQEDVATLDAEATESFSDELVLAEPMAEQRQSNGAPALQAAPSGGVIGEDFAALPQEPDTEEFANEDPSGIVVTAEQPFSTFSIDVDTASYSIVRNSINNGFLPNAEAVRIEEMINYFPYDYPAPSDGEAPFRATYSVFETPWNSDTQILQIGIQGEMPAIEDRPPLNLVFLIDSSGSMNDAAKLPLLRQSFQLMLGQLRPEDRIAIVAYAGSSGLVLEPTSAEDVDTIVDALFQLSAGGSTAGQAGLEQAYSVARDMVEEGPEGAVSRVILATDGDFNVGISDPEALTTYIEGERESGIYLSVLGFGRGNLDDATMQALAQNGNGTAAYIDTLAEAQKVLVDQLTGSLFPIADDVKIQVNFNPAEIAEYRLIGYETRALNREDFNNDAVDAGEIGAGISVTAIYEITPVGSPAVLTDPSRYEQPQVVAEYEGELGMLRLRYKAPGEDESTLIETPIVDAGVAPSQDALFASAIAGWGQLLRGGDFLGDWDYDEVIALASANRGEDEFGYRIEAVNLMRLAQSLSR